MAGDVSVGASVGASLDRVLREERTRLVAALVRILGDCDLAGELVQDAAVAALEHWPTDGVPRNPAAWLMTTARWRWNRWICWPDASTVTTCTTRSAPSSCVASAAETKPATQTDGH